MKPISERWQFTRSTRAFHRPAIAGKVLLEATRLGATHALLEVRACNQDALHLYNKFGFAVVGVRKGYYQDAGEDALLMTLNPLVPEILAELVDNR